MRAHGAGDRTINVWIPAVTLLLGVGLALFSPSLRAQAGVQGQWRTLASLMPINPVHLALMNNGKVLIVSGSGNVATVTTYQAAVWDPQAETLVTQSLTWDMFCNGMVILPDGRPFVVGGNLQYDPFLGQPRTAAFDPAAGTFTDLQNMAHGRWYPTATVLGDGRVMTFSGTRETGDTNTAVELYTPGTGWSAESPAGWTPPLYPRLHLLPSGSVLYSGSGTGSRTFNPATRTWSKVIATTNYAGTRKYGTSVLLPLTPANGYQPRVIIMGGGNPATATTEIIDMSAATPKWQFGPPMSQPRIEMNATILPNGKVLALGGSTNDEVVSTASLNADLFDPVTNTFSSAGANAFPRLYHSASLLLPDATVLLTGGNPARGKYEPHTEIYSPAYLFNANGTPALRPTIAGVAPGTLTYGGTFQLQTPDAANISSVVLVRPGAPTHAFDMEQRLVGLSYTVGAGVLNVSAPPNGNIAPPGYYMLFVVNAAGVPSVASFVLVSATVEPVVTITAPSNGASVSGSTVTVSATATDSLGISGVQFKLDGVSLGGEDTVSPFSIAWDSTSIANGSHTLTAVARDPAGRVASSAPATVTVNNPDVVPPTVSVTTPVNGATVSGTTVTVSAGASDNVGVAGVQFLLDGAALGAEVTAAPYTRTWNTTTASNGAHTVAARARDAAANATTSTLVNVNVSNPVSNPPAIDAVVSVDGAGSSTTIATAAFSTTAGNELLLAFVATDYLGGTNTTVTGVSGAGLTWQLVKRTNAQSGTSEIWRAFAAVPLTGVTATATLSQAVSAAMTVVTFANVDTSGTNGSGAIGATASASSASGAPAATLVTTRNNSWVFGVGNDYDNPTPRTVGSGQTLVHQYLAPVGDTYWVQRRTSAVALGGTSVTISDTAPTGDRYNLTICEIRQPLP
jgi:Galactose oxidase-like, Early set domain/Bacterial Ig domain